MGTLLIVLGGWIALSILAAGLIAMGGAIGRRRGFEEGREALRRANAADRPRLVVLDQRMPEPSAAGRRA